MSGLSREQAYAALRWLVESGADEAIAETPVNRMLAPPPAVAERPREIEHPPPPVPAKRPSVPAPKPAPATAASDSPAKIAAACQSLEQLRAAMDAFEGLELKRLATKTVFADGNPAGGIMLIGEAPGAEEDAQGLPFVGRAGQLLDRMLGAIGLNRQKVYITNIINWRPPKNRDPSPEEAAICLPFLHRHIELADPKLLILLGAVPVRHLMGHPGIMRVRGKWETYRFQSSGREVPVMLTLHPAFLLRQPAAKRLAWQDFLAVAERAASLGLA